MCKSKNKNNFLVLIDNKIKGNNVIDVMLKHKIVTIFKNKVPIILNIPSIPLCESKYLIQLSQVMAQSMSISNNEVVSLSRKCMTQVLRLPVLQIIPLIFSSILILFHGVLHSLVQQNLCPESQNREYRDPLFSRGLLFENLRNLLQ